MERKFYQRCFYKKPRMKTEELMREMGQPLQTGDERRRDKESEVLPDGWCQGWRSPEPEAAATTHKHAPHLIRQLFDLHGLPSRKTPSAHTHTCRTHRNTLIMAYPLLIRAASLLTESTSASRLPHHFTYTLGLILSEQGGGAGSMSVVMSLLTERQLVCRKRRFTN